MTKNELMDKTREMQAAPSCYAGLKKIAQDWLDAVGTAQEHESAQVFARELEADVQSIDAVISFMDSDAGTAHLGAETARAIAAHAREVKAAGGKYCDCPACSAGLTILSNRDVLLG